MPDRAVCGNYYMSANTTSSNRSDGGLGGDLEWQGRDRWWVSAAAEVHRSSDTAGQQHYTTAVHVGKHFT
jgi:hypothetical protein